MNKFIYIVLLVCFTSYSQDYYYINAENGLNVRAEPELSSEKTAKLPFGVIVEKTLDTNTELSITDNGKQIKGHWVKIRYGNYPYLVSQETESYKIEGYVFDGYLKKMKLENSIAINKINKSTFNELLKGVTTEIYKPKKISNLDSVKTILKGRVEWITKDDVNEDYYTDGLIKSITKANGQKLIINKRSADYVFTEGYSGYYPEYDILLLEGGHASDVSFSIKTGEITDTAGNPESIISSPKNTYRLNGVFGGQECVSYFFQKKLDGEFTYLTEFYWDDDLCTFKEFYWTSETTFMYSRMNYQNDSINEEFEYFIGKINSDD
jgi:hypothetical protein